MIHQTVAEGFDRQSQYSCGEYVADLEQPLIVTVEPEEVEDQGIGGVAEVTDVVVPAQAVVVKAPRYNQSRK